MPTMDEQELQQVKAADPFTVISKAKDDLHQGKRDSPWIEEGLSRFELQCKAGYGTNVPVGSGSGSSRT